MESSSTDKISENCGRFDGQLFQHLIIKDFRVDGQSFGISGLRPQAAIPTAACTGEYASYAASPVTISHITIPKLYTLLIHVSLTLSGSPAIICAKPDRAKKFKLITLDNQIEKYIKKLTSERNSNEIDLQKFQIP